jgi:YbbR domain-containing protein
MKSTNPSNILLKKTIKWLFLLMVLGICVFLIWPTPLTEIDIFIPVQHENIPDGLTVSPPFPKGIEVSISGPRSTLKTIKTNIPPYTLDLSNGKIGDLMVPIDKDSISLPPDITIKKVSPSFLTVTIEKESIKIVPVNVSLLNKPAAGHNIVKIAASPDSVTLKGPKSKLDPIKKIQTKPVDINGASESFRKETTLDLDEGIQNTGPSEAIRVEISIQEKVDFREFKDIPIRGINTRYSYHISPAVIEIKVKGPINKLNKLDAGTNIKVHIDLKELQPGLYMKAAAILLPVDITLIQVDPEIFTVEIDNKPATSE